MAERLKNQGIRIDLFLSSPAKRAITTAIGHAKAFGLPAHKVEQDERLYHASSTTIRQLVSSTDDRFETIALFGHNPGLTDLINSLSELDLWNLPTCAVCGIQFETDSWKNILNSTGNSFYYDFPKSKTNKP